jgi:glutathione synthase/RimK-type ligase-like ATP-grasp enzyme
MPCVALATCSQFPDLDPENAPLMGLLAAAGVRGDPAVWDDPSVDWSSFDLVVIRATWDYPQKFDACLAWAARQRRLLNPLPVIRWNADKRYLNDLAAAGVPAIPTTFVGPGEPFTPPPGPFVVKPSIGVGAKDAARYGPGQEEAARRHVLRLNRGARTAMVQPCLARVEEEGEIDLVFIGGRYSHSVRKGGMLDGPRLEMALFFHEEVGGREATRAERELAERAMEVVPGGGGGLLFGRVDLLPAENGEPLVSEVEVLEPSLFFGRQPGSAERLASLIAEAARA